jgi:hypothetical protein
VEVVLKPLGCVGCLGTMLSLGLMPLFRRHIESKFPRMLSETGMQLRSGADIPWSGIKRVWKSDTYAMDRYVFTQYVIWHAAGRVTFPTHRLQGADAVIAYIIAHLPLGVRLEEGSPTILRGYRRF